MIPCRKSLWSTALPLEGESTDREPQGRARGTGWSDLAAQTRAEATAAGDNRFDRVDALSRRPGEDGARPVELRRRERAARRASARRARA